MRLLVAEDDALTRRVLRSTLLTSGYDVLEARDGSEAFSILDSPEPPRLVLLDWMMPGMNGLDICRRLRAREDAKYTYILLITAKGNTEDVVTGLEAGADDYLTKPCNPDELRYRIKCGERVLNLKSALEGRIKELRAAMALVEKLQKLLPICVHCKNIRDDSRTWHRIESYIEKNSNAMFTHSLCNDCLHQHYPEYANQESTSEPRDDVEAAEETDPSVAATNPATMMEHES